MWEKKTLSGQDRTHTSPCCCCCCSVAEWCPTLCDPMALQAPLSSTISQSLLKLLSIESAMSSNHLML